MEINSRKKSHVRFFSSGLPLDSNGLVWVSKEMDVRIRSKNSRISQAQNNLKSVASCI